MKVGWFNMDAAAGEEEVEGKRVTAKVFGVQTNEFILNRNKNCRGGGEQKKEKKKKGEYGGVT